MTNWDTDLVLVENPMARALKAHLIIPVPGSTSEVTWLGIVGFREGTSSVFKVISLEAFRASSILVMFSTKIRNRDANFLGVEDPAIGALQADVVVPIPSSTSEV